MIPPLAASLAVVLVVSASAHAAPVKTPFGPIPPGWATVFRPLAVEPDGFLRSRALPSGVPASVQDMDLLTTLSPVAKALENAGLGHEDFRALNPDRQRYFLEKALANADIMVLLHARDILDRVPQLRDEQDREETFAELNGLNAFSGYLAGEENADLRAHISAARRALLQEQNRRLNQSAAQTAQALAGRADALENEADGHGEASLLAARRSSLERIAALEAEIRSKRSVNPKTLVTVRQKLETFGQEDDEAIQRAVVQALVKSAEIPKTSSDGDLIGSYLRAAAQVAVASRFPNIKRLGQNALVDNRAVAQKGSAHRATAAEGVSGIANSTDDKKIKGEALALLARELRSIGGNDPAAGIIAREIARIGTGAKPDDLPYPALEAKASDRELRVESAYEKIIVTAIAFLVAGLPSLWGGSLSAFFLAVFSFAVIGGVIVIAINKSGVPWYRKKDGTPPDAP